MMKAASIDRDKALAQFEDGKARSPKDIAVACGVHTRTAVWFMVHAERRGWLKRLPQRPLVRNPDFGQFVRTA